MPEKHAWARWFWLTMGACALAQLVLAGATAGYEADYNTFWAWAARLRAACWLCPESWPGQGWPPCATALPGPAVRAAFCWALPPGPALRFCM